MNGKLPVLSGKDVVKEFSKAGYSLDHQTGSHMILRHKDPPHRRLTIPNHPEVSRGTLRAIITQAGLTRDEFFKRTLNNWGFVARIQDL